MSSLKERNGGIGAFPPRGYSTFMTELRDSNKGKEKWLFFFSFFLYACVCVCHSQ